MTRDKIIAGGITICFFLAIGAYLMDWSKLDLSFDLKWPDFSSESSSSNKSKKRNSSSPRSNTATIVDTYRGVDIFDNGTVRQTHGRNVTKDGYNLGLKYQCVEFVKRFYYEFYDHKMPNSYGNAKDFFKTSLADGALNTERNLYQFKNGSLTQPVKNDILVVGASKYNSFGHVAIISKVSSSSVEIVQQNPGRGNPSRESFVLSNRSGKWFVEMPAVLGWLGKR